MDDAATAWKCLHHEVSQLLAERTTERDTAQIQAAQYLKAWNQRDIECARIQSENDELRAKVTGKSHISDDA